MKPKEAFSLLKATFFEWLDDQAPMLGAALAYYTVFSLAPLLIITIAIAGLIFGAEAAQGQIFDQLRGLLGAASCKAMEEIVQSASEEPKTGMVATVIGFVTLLFGASGVFGQLQASLNIIWGVQPKPGRGVLGIVRDRFLSFGFILVVGFLLLVSLLLTAVIAFVGKQFGTMVPGMEAVIQLLNSILSLAVITLLFAMMFKILPDANIAWCDVWIGAFITARSSRSGNLHSVFIWDGAVLPPPMARRVPSLSCSYGSITRPKLSFSERSLRRFMRIDLDCM